MQVYIENTLKAIENAHKKEADMIEFDVFENKEGNLYVSHDPNLKRIAKVNKNISDMTDAELDSIVLSD
jgi:glycerophosphodiester phosphodiesterase domain-containing protein 1